MDMLSKLPTMEDTALKNLLVNAQRLSDEGTKTQMKAAAELLPAVEAELAQRQEIAKAAALAKRRSTRRGKSAVSAESG